jgi:hypothetical protein
LHHGTITHELKAVVAGSTASSNILTISSILNIFGQAFAQRKYHFINA